jgi:cobalt-zinc-cadmium efflux system outer membrane protein
MHLARAARRGVAAAALAVLTSFGAAAQPGDGGEPTGLVDLAQAQAAALRARPELAVADAELRARAAAERQAGARPNPELSLEVEDVAGSGDFAGAGEAQTTLRYFQPLELGGDRGARRRVAAGRRDLAGFDADARRLDVLADTAGAFVEVLIAQEELHHAGELVAVAVDERGAAGERVRAGAALAVEATRARLAEDDARIHEARGARALEAARLRLVATWNGAEPRFDRAVGDLHGVAPPPPLEALVARLPANPDLARFEAERTERESALALARARRVPDPRVGAGVRHLAASDDAALVFEVAVPLPLFDRHAGSIEEAAERVASVAHERAAAERALRAHLVAEHARWLAAYEETIAIRDRLLPAAQQALAELRAGWRNGRVSQLEVLAAQRAQFDAVDRMLHALGETHAARIASERLVGGSVDELR